MVMPHGTVKSGQTRNVNRMGATNRMVSFCSQHTSKPVSINYLRVMVKNLNKTIDSLASEPATQMRLIHKRQCVYTAVKLFQAAYAAKDFSALSARNYCRMNQVPLPNGNGATMKETGDAVQRICDNLGTGYFDATGMHIVERGGKPRIPGGFNTGNRELLGAEIDVKDASVVFSPKSAEYHAEGRDKLNMHLQWIVRPLGGNGSVKVNGRAKIVPGQYARSTKGSRNMYYDRVEGKNVLISNAPVVKDRIFSAPILAKKLSQEDEA
jgi:hypothetical protein